MAEQKTSFIANALKGAGMGLAEVIPGVSGGTIAFITGIYETLLNSIKAFSPKLLRLFLSGGIKSVWKEVNGPFLLSLLCGMVGGIVIGIFGISYLMENFPVLVWAFFFGLIMGSSLFIARQIPKWGGKEILGFVLGAVFAFGITLASPAEGNQSLWFVYLSGIIGVSALMLPGLSGSFMLLLMGMYKFIVTDTLKVGILENFDPKAMLTMLVFGIGALTSLATVSRLLSWTFKNHRYVTLAVLTGFMLGSLNKVWPWKKPVLGLTEAGETVQMTKGMEVDKILKEVALMPNQFAAEVGNPQTIGVVLLMFLGFALVFVLDKFGNTKQLS